MSQGAPDTPDSTTNHSAAEREMTGKPSEDVDQQDAARKKSIQAWSASPRLTPDNESPTDDGNLGSQEDSMHTLPPPPDGEGTADDTRVEVPPLQLTESAVLEEDIKNRVIGKLAIHNFEPFEFTDNCIVNQPTIAKLQQSILFPLTNIAMLFLGVGLRFFAYDWDWPDALGFLKSDNYSRSTTCYAFSGVFLLVPHWIMVSAHNRELMKLVHKSFDFWFLSINFVGHAVLDAYDVATTQPNIHPACIAVTMLAYVSACQNLFGTDALSVHRGGSRALKTLLFIVAWVFWVTEVLLWRWYRPSRNSALSLPFFEATVGGLASSIAVNQMFYSTKLILAGLLKDRCVFVLNAPLDIYDYTAEQEKEKVETERLERISRMSAQTPQSATLVAAETKSE